MLLPIFHINERVGIFSTAFENTFEIIKGITAHSKTIRVSCTFD